MDGKGKALAGCLMALSAIIYPSFSVLFIAMGIAHYHILKKDKQQKAVCLIRIYTTAAAFVVCLFLLWLLSSSEWDIRGMKADRLKDVLESVPENFYLANVLISIIYIKKNYKVKFVPITFRERQGGKFPEYDKDL